ncbi:MAG: hypothetical protein IPH00_01445 [Flavobacteriales bacterium]|nr:hypothetical protein [Flavobacteriales bacterium]
MKRTQAPAANGNARNSRASSTGLMAYFDLSDDPVEEQLHSSFGSGRNLVPASPWPILSGKGSSCERPRGSQLRENYIGPDGDLARCPISLPEDRNHPEQPMVDRIFDLYDELEKQRIVLSFKGDLSGSHQRAIKPCGTQDERFGAG